MPIDPRVAAACSPALRAVRGVLADPALPVTPRALERLREFLCDGTVSPLHRRHAGAAALAARELAFAFTVPAGVRGPD